MDLTKSPLITQIKGTIKAGKSKLAFRTTPQGKTVTVITPHDLPPKPENTIGGYIRIAWAACDTRWGIIPEDAKSMWRTIANRYHRGGRSALDQFKSINLRRLICCMPGLDYPPNPYYSHYRTLSGYITSATLPEGYEVLVYTHGKTFEPTDFDELNGDWKVPHAQLHPYCICRAMTPSDPWCQNACPETYTVVLADLICQCDVNLVGRTEVSRIYGCQWDYYPWDPPPEAYFNLTIHDTSPYTSSWFLDVICFACGAQIVFDLHHCPGEGACGYYGFLLQNLFKTYPDQAHVLPP